jgi:hypothetical protein
MTKIEDIIKKYKEEWVLIKVEKVDELDRPIEGEVIQHTKVRDEIYKKQREVKGDIAILYTGKIPKNGYAVAFNG